MVDAFSEYWSKDVSVLATLEFCRDRKVRKTEGKVANERV
jgi:hypothetical protein